ncbi:hypothetical protein [Rahnella aquatilis]|uniref:hypothetical protein n=1 Tax=Rahnella aquatilis TaxID=34038 RepID=UPI00064681F1|nr:hypothetical protein [Rahnella aquatilis]
MSLDPTKISLKGFYLDPTTDVVGGTRNIFSNGVMCAKVYLGFSYNAPDGDTSTVRDIIKWLLANGALRSEAGNRTDNGTLDQFGWTDYGNTDPNGDEYVYDTTVVVPKNTENFDQMPGDAKWHFGYFLRAPRDGIDPLNVYYLASDLAEYPDLTLTTMSDALMTISPASTPVVSKDDFIIKDIEIITMGGDDSGQDGRVLRELNYNDSYDSSIYGIKSFYKIYPSTETSSEDNVPYDITPENAGYPAKNIFALQSEWGNHNSDRVIYVLNKFHSGFKISSLAGNYFYSSIGYWRDEGHSDNKIYIDGGFEGFDSEFDSALGLPIGTQASSYIAVQPFSGDSGYATSIDNYADNDDHCVSIYVHDSFGTSICIEIDLDHNDNWMFEWAVKSAYLSN